MSNIHVKYKLNVHVLQQYKLCNAKRSIPFVFMYFQLKQHCILLAFEQVLKEVEVDSFGFLDDLL